MDMVIKFIAIFSLLSLVVILVTKHHALQMAIYRARYHNKKDEKFKLNIKLEIWLVFITSLSIAYLI